MSVTVVLLVILSGIEKRKKTGTFVRVEFLSLFVISQPEYRSKVSNGWGKCCFQQGKRATQEGVDTAWNVAKIHKNKL